jgi:hypothetical protein
LEELRDFYAEAVKPGEEGWLMRNALYDGQTVLRMRMLEETDGPHRRYRYEALRLKARALARDELELQGVFGTDSVYISTALSSQRFTPTTPRQR